jgi:ParB-like chromosome segregation protein Spo0J
MKTAVVLGVKTAATPAQYNVHPAAELFPMLEEKQLKELAADIKANGLQQPVVIHNEVVLDGRNRLAACKLVGVKPLFVNYEGDDPVAFIISSNLHRRHLTDNQRVMVAAKLAKLPHGGDRRSDQAARLPLETPTQARAAQLLNVSPRSVRKARALDAAAPELAREVARGKLTLNAATKKARRDKPPKVQTAHVTIVEPEPTKVETKEEWATRRQQFLAEAKRYKDRQAAADKIEKRKVKTLADLFVEDLRAVLEPACRKRIGELEYDADDEPQEKDIKREIARAARDVAGQWAVDALDEIQTKIKTFDATREAEIAFPDPADADADDQQED